MSYKLNLDFIVGQSPTIRLPEALQSITIQSVALLDANRNNIASDSGIVTLQFSKDGISFSQSEIISVASFTEKKLTVRGAKYVKISGSGFVSSSFVSLKTSSVAYKEAFGDADLPSAIDELSKTIETTLANLGSASAAGKEVVLVDSFGKLMKSVGTEYRELAFITSDQMPSSKKQITATGQIAFGKGKVVSMTLLSGSITELTLRDSVNQTYNAANTTDPIVYTYSPLPISVPVDFYFGLHATVAGASPVILLEIEA